MYYRPESNNMCGQARQATADPTMPRQNRAKQGTRLCQGAGDGHTRALPWDSTGPAPNPHAA